MYEYEYTCGFCLIYWGVRIISVSYTHLRAHETGAYRVCRLLLESHIDRDNERTISSFRSTLYRLHMDFTKQKYVTPEGLKTFKEIGKVYVEAGGDDIYHDKLEPEVLRLPIHYEEEPI